MLSPGQSQHDHTALIYLGLKVLLFEGSKTKCEGGRDVTPPTNTVSSVTVAVCSLSKCPILLVVKVYTMVCGVIDQALCCPCCVKPISNCCNGSGCLWW